MKAWMKTSSALFGLQFSPSKCVMLYLSLCYHHFELLFLILLPSYSTCQFYVNSAVDFHCMYSSVLTIYRSFVLMLYRIVDRFDIPDFKLYS